MFQSNEILNAVENVGLLKSTVFKDDVPCMQAANSAIKYDVNFNTNNADGKGFRLVQAIYKEEAEVHSELNNILEKGKEFVILLYTWRSCSRALPTVTNKDAELNNLLQEKTIEILKPSIQKLKEFKNFQVNALEKFCAEVEKLCKRRKRDEFLSDAYMVAMSNILKMFALLDEMKNMKASMKNDHTQYKRAAQHLKIIDSVDATEYSMYLAQQNVIRSELKSRLSKIAGFEEFFLDLVNLCVSMYLQKLYLFPEEKHTLVLVIAFSLYLMDTNGDVVVNINKQKKIQLSKIDQIFKECEVVNVFGDMSIYPFSFIQSTPNYEPSKWPECTGTKTSSQGVFLNYISQFRSEYTSLTAELARYSNSIVVSQNDESKERNKMAYELALKALQLLSKWTTQIIDTFSWKLGHLADPRSNPEVIPPDAEDYEKATRYNYDSQEKFAFIEVIAMIKTIQNQITRLESHFLHTIVPHIYTELQTFLHVSLPEIYVKLSKKTKLPILFQSLWAVGLDKTAIDGKFMNIVEKSGTISGKKAVSELLTFGEDLKTKIKPRSIPPGSTQLYLIRCIVESFFQNKTKNANRKEIDSQSLTILEDFYTKSFHWSYLLNFGETLKICCDLSQLWYREFFLEMTNGKRIQFPIETSIPCILTNHILDTQDPAYIEYLLYPLDLYNDSAICALKKFKRQFLYNEIEAEVNFMMIQLIVRLSDQIFLYYKQFAASMLLNKRFRSQVNASGRNTINYPAPERYINLMKQRHLQLLGRSFNLCKLISNRINKSIYESLETAVKRFKRHGLTSILEFDSLLELNRLCYDNLAQYLELDNFDAMLTEITQSTTSTFGSITSFIIDEIVDVICPNFAYNSGTNRFVPMLEPYRHPPIETTTVDRTELLWGSKHLNSYFESILKLYSDFLGKDHFLKISQYIGYDGLYWLMMKMNTASESFLYKEVRHYTSHLTHLVPANLSLKLDGKTSADQYKIICEELRRMIDVRNLKTEIAQAFNKFGNCIIVLLQIENHLCINEALELKQAYPFVNMLPKPFLPPNLSSCSEEIENTKRKLDCKYQIFNIKNLMDKFGRPEQLELSKQHFDVTKERLCKEYSVFQKFLQYLKDILYNDMVEANEEATYDDSVLINFWTRKEVSKINASFEFEGNAFYMVWSAIVFVICKTASKQSGNAEEMFGEGIFWSGCVIMSLLGQQHLFDCHDICGKFMRSHKISKKDGRIESELDVISKRIRNVLQIHRRIFDIYNRYLWVTDDYSYLASTIAHIPLTSDDNRKTIYDEEEFDD